MMEHEFNAKKTDTKRLLEALEKLNAEQTKAFTDAIVGASMMNRLVELHREKQAAGKPLTA